ncbi:hypothetical protein GCM10010174_68130 [Kutzneria viridogrisea]
MPGGVEFIVRTNHYTEQDHHEHVPWRHKLLDAGEVLPSPLGGAVRACGPRPKEVLALVATDLSTHGVAAVQLNEPFSDNDFVEFGAGLGTATEETDPAVQPFVTDGVILNLLGKHHHTNDVSLQPFAENSLSLHSEGSGRIAAEQPRYIVLMCCHPGDDPTSSQTVLISMADVAARLSAQQVKVLSRTRYAHLPAGETIVRLGTSQPVFSFRDFLGDRLDWINDEDDDPETVNAAIGALLAAMYAPGAAGVHWRRGLMVVIDNTRHFHGRTAGLVSVRNPRHLKRLRIR